MGWQDWQEEEQRKLHKQMYGWQEPQNNEDDEQRLDKEEKGYAKQLESGERATIRSGFFGIGKKTVERSGDEIIVRGTLGMEEKRVKVEQLSSCFVASVIYGGEDKPQVQMLRDFRDKILMPHTIGRFLVIFYYGGVGKKAANFVNKHLHIFIPLIRWTLDKVVHKYSQRFAAYEFSKEKSVGLCKRIEHRLCRKSPSAIADVVGDKPTKQFCP